MRKRLRRGGIAKQTSCQPRHALWAIVLLLASCNAPVTPPPLAAVSTSSEPSAVTPNVVTPTASADSAPTAADPAPTTLAQAPTPTNAWQTIAEGMAHRVLPVSDGSGALVEQLYVLRFDPAYFRFDVAYRPSEPITLPEWLELTGADVVLNGGFFTEAYYATGLTIVDGDASGASYDFGGMVAIKDGALNVQPLSAEPYAPEQALDAGLQAFPLLINRDGTAAFTEPSTNRARRTIIAQDRSGHVLFMLANRNYFTLTELSTFLEQSDLDLAIALNLDGGPSSGLLIQAPQFAIPSPVLLPTVLTVHRRSQ